MNREDRLKRLADLTAAIEADVRPTVVTSPDGYGGSAAVVYGQKTLAALEKLSGGKRNAGASHKADASTATARR